MKKIIAAGLLIASSSLVLANGYTGPFNQQNTGYTGPTNSGVPLTTVKKAKTMWDDSYVTLRGKIINHIKKDKYTFQDSTGTVLVEIDNDLWYGTTIGPNDTVEIIGEVDKDGYGAWSKVEIDAKNIRKV